MHGVDPATGDILLSRDKNRLFSVSENGTQTELDPDENYEFEQAAYVVGGRTFLNSEDEPGALEYVGGSLAEVSFSIPSLNFTGALPYHYITRQLDADRFVIDIDEGLENVSDAESGVVRVTDDGLVVEQLLTSATFVEFVESPGSDPNYFTAVSTDVDGFTVSFNTTVVDADGNELFTILDEEALRLIAVDDTYFYLSSRIDDGGKIRVFERAGTVGTEVATLTGFEGYELLLSAGHQWQIDVGLRGYRQSGSAVVAGPTDGHPGGTERSTEK